MRLLAIGAVFLAHAFFAETTVAQASGQQVATPTPSAGGAATPKPIAIPASKEETPAPGTPPPDQKPPGPAPGSPAESPAPGATAPEGSPKPEAPAEASPEKSPAPDGGQPSNTPPGGPSIPPLPILPQLPPLPTLPPLPGSEPLPTPTLPSIEPMAPGSELLLIPNGILPNQKPPIIPTPDVMGFKPPPTLPTAVEILKPEEMTLPVSKFNLRYALSPGQKGGPPLPPIERLQKAATALVESNGVLIAPAPQTAAGSTVSVSLGDTPAKPRKFRGDAIEKLGQAVVSQINKAGVYEVYVIPDPTQIDRGKPKEYDQRAGKTELSMLIYVSQIVETRSLRQKAGAAAGAPPVIDDPRDARLLAKSPVGGRAGSSLLYKPALQDYLERVNRYPGREVETEITPTGEQRKLILDFVVHEDKPLSIYAGTENSGTPSTGIWRTRVGMEEKQLLRLDDVLRAEYVGAHLSDYYAGLLSYEFAPIFPDYLKFKTFGAFAKFSSDDIGYSLQDFESSTWTAGGQITWTPVYVQGFPLDLNVGFQWMRVDVDHRNVARDGLTDFALPYIGISTDRRTDKFTLSANAQVEFNWFRMAGTQEADLPTLGRANADRHFTLATWNFTGSTFLEPLIFGKDWDNQKVWWKSTRAHEFAVSFHGQVALDKSRLPPELQMTVGGFETVRGYPEALAVGDTVMVASAEYRFHVPREFFSFGGGGRRDARETQIPDFPVLPPKPGAMLDPRYNSRATSISSRPDWDVILRGFFDFGETFNDKIDPETERNRTLASVGGGVEFQFYKPLFITLRMDVGCPLITERDALGQGVDAGGVRFHFSGSIAW